uniref:Uncharacterized protein n=1 Tax=Anguilla anguilla TaxID=7936 RepID=A0A0E9TKH9_ANGAN
MKFHQSSYVSVCYMILCGERFIRGYILRFVYF